MGKIQLEDVQRLDLRPGDTLLVTVPQHTTSESAHHASQFLQDRLDTWHPGCHVLVVTKDMEVSVIPRADGEPG